MDYKNFQKILAFFSALNDSGFKKTLKDISSFTTIGGQRTPVDKAKSMELLRLLPDFQGDEFKDDNNIVKYLSDPRNRDRIWGKFSREQQKELTKTLNEKPLAKEGVVYQQGGQEAPVEQTPTEGTSGGSGGGIPNIGMPSAPAISSPSAGREIHEVPHALETPKPDIAVAGSSGAATEAGDASKLVSAGKGGNIVEAGKPSDLVTAHASGAIKEAPPKQIFIANKNNVVTGIQNIKSPSWFKTFGSNAQIFAKRNLGRIADGLTHSVLPSGANFLGKTGLKAFNHGGNFLSNLSNIRSKASASAKSLSSSKSLSTKKWALAAGGAFFLFFFMSAFGGITGDTSTSEAASLPEAPPTTLVASCPVLNGKITTGSYQADPTNGHCSDSYRQIESCGDSGDRNCRFTSRKSKSIDVYTGGPNGKDVILPKIEGKDVNWKLLQILCSAHGQTYPNCGSVGGETGLMYVFETIPQNSGESKWDLQLIHMLDNPNIKLGETYISGTPLGKTDIEIVHVTIGKDIKNPTGSGSESTDCDSGWIQADTTTNSICPNQ